ncbi:13750_t:CDS:2 [Entrophospora sp. SA101]|nr:13750_t:CDS:2 [Entrophospora sp. SA101]
MSVSSDNFTLKQPHYHALYQPSWREKLAVELDNTAIGSIWKIVDAFLNILLCMIYIAHTGHMMKSLPLVNVCLEVIVSLLLIIEYVPKFYIYEFESWKSFFTSPIPLLTILTVFPCAATAHDPVFQETRYILIKGKTKYSKYVYTCPRYNVMLRDDDKVFVLSKQIPSIL